jgi:hypothetical protein
MPDEPEARVARKALKFTGDVAAGKHLPGFIAHDLTQEQAEVWLTDAQYTEMLASGFYDEATKTEAKAIEAEAAPDADAPDPPKRRSSKE